VERNSFTGVRKIVIRTNSWLYTGGNSVRSMKRYAFDELTASHSRRETKSIPSSFFQANSLALDVKTPRFRQDRKEVY